MAAAATRPGRAPHPVAFDVEYQERHSRWKTFLRLLLAIPQIVVIYLLVTAVYVVTLLAWFAILFTKRYPKGLFDFSAGALRWVANVAAYNALLRDEYPPFSWEPGLYPVTLVVERPEQQSRWRLFVRAFALIPNQIVFYFVQLAWMVALFITWCWIVVSGRHPRRLFDFSVGTLRWNFRQLSYMLLLRDEYPPYRLRADAPPGNEVVSAVIGFPILVAYVALYAFFLAGPYATFWIGGTETVLVQSPLGDTTLRQEAPSGSAGGVRVTLLGYDDDAPGPIDDPSIAFHRLVSFRVLAEKDGWLPAWFTAFFIRLEDCRGEDYFVHSTSGGVAFAFFWFGGSEEGNVFYEIPLDVRPCRLIYQPGLGKVEFLFDRSPVSPGFQ